MGYAIALLPPGPDERGLLMGVDEVVGFRPQETPGRPIQAEVQ
jgi:hypothetical protein